MFCALVAFGATSFRRPQKQIMHEGRIGFALRLRFESSFILLQAMHAWVSIGLCTPLLAPSPYGIGSAQVAGVGAASVQHGHAEELAAGRRLGSHPQALSPFVHQQADFPQVCVCLSVCVVGSSLAG